MNLKEHARRVRKLINREDRQNVVLWGYLDFVRDCFHVWIHLWKGHKVVIRVPARDKKPERIGQAQEKVYFLQKQRLN